MPVPTSINDLVTTPAGNSPSGGEQVFPNLDDYLRAHAAFIAQVRDLVAVAAPELGMTRWWGGIRSAIPVRNLPQDGQILNRADYPDLWSIISTGGMPMISDTEWLDAPTKRASFSSGNGATTFRMPDLNGKWENSIGAVVLRGDGAKSAGSSGLIRSDQNASHSHAATVAADGSHTHGVNDPGHSHQIRTNYRDGPGDGRIADSGGQPSATGATTHNYTGISIQSSGSHSHTASISNSGGDEVRMKEATGVWVMRVK